MALQIARYKNTRALGGLRRRTPGGGHRLPPRRPGGAAAPGGPAARAGSRSGASGCRRSSRPAGPAAGRAGPCAGPAGPGRRPGRPGTRPAEGLGGSRRWRSPRPAGAPPTPARPAALLKPPSREVGGWFPLPWPFLPARFSGRAAATQPAARRALSRLRACEHPQCSGGLGLDRRSPPGR